MSHETGGDRGSILNAMNQPPIPRLIHLCAIDPGRNVVRDYSIWVVPDLFGQWIVETRWVRIGTKGQSQQRSFADARTAQAHVRPVLRKRRRAKARIGVDYRLIVQRSGH